jgi:hypothetical protein
LAALSQPLKLLFLHLPFLEAPLCGYPAALLDDCGDALGYGIPFPNVFGMFVQHEASLLNLRVAVRPPHCQLLKTQP